MSKELEARIKALEDKLAAVYPSSLPQNYNVGDMDTQVLANKSFVGSTAMEAASINGYTLTVNGNVTLNNWFDQSVKTTASPTFVGLDLSAGPFNIGDYIAEKQLLVAFTNGVADQKADIYMTGTQTFWGTLLVEVISGFTHQNAAGRIAKTFYLGMNSGGGASIYKNDANYTEVGGVTADNFAISDLSWDSTNSRYKITIVHRVSTGNTAIIRLRTLCYGATITNFLTFTAGSVYTTDATVYSRPYVQLPNTIGFGSSDIEAWTTYKAIEANSTAIAMGSATRELYLFNNLYYDGALKRKTANVASYIGLGPDGAIYHCVIGTGAADSTVNPLTDVIDTITIEPTGQVQIGSTTNHTDFDADGHQTMTGTAKPWEDLRIEPVARTTGANAPTFEQWADDSGLGDTGSSRGIYLYSFDDASAGSEKEVFFTMQLPHAWDSGSIALHVHWIGAVADTTAAPRWGLEYTWKEIGATYAGTATVYTDGINYTASGTDADIVAGKHYISKFSTWSPGSAADGISSIIIGRLFRDCANAADTYNASGAKCGLLYIDAHYQINSIGSTDEYTK